MLPRQPIVLIGVSHEMAHLYRHLAGLRGEQRPWGRLLAGRWRRIGLEVVLVETAVGKVGAAMAAQGAIDAVHPRLLLNCGSAGALAPTLRVGDLVIGDALVAHDQGAYLPTRLATHDGNGDAFVHVGTPLPGGRRRSFRPDPALLARVTTAARQARLNGNLHIGTIATGDQVIFQDRRKQWLYRHFGALAVENEGAAIAQVAHCHGLPWLVIRAISDAAGDEAAFDYRPLIHYDEDGPPPGRLRLLLRTARLGLSRPDTLRRIQRFRRGVRQAMDRLAELLEVLLPVL